MILQGKQQDAVHSHVETEVPEVTTDFFLCRSSLHTCKILHSDVGQYSHPGSLEQTPQKDNHHTQIS